MNKIEAWKKHRLERESSDLRCKKLGGVVGDRAVELMLALLHNSRFLPPPSSNAQSSFPRHIYLKLGIYAAATILLVSVRHVSQVQTCEMEAYRGQGPFVTNNVALLVPAATD
jgi:hypothetical protein